MVVSHWYDEGDDIYNEALDWMERLVPILLRHDFRHWSLTFRSVYDSWYHCVPRSPAAMVERGPRLYGPEIACNTSVNLYWIRVAYFYGRMASAARSHHRVSGWL